MLAPANGSERADFAGRRVHVVPQPALDVLMEEGGAGFSLGKVAARAGLSVERLRLDYPSRSHLLRELFAHAVGARVGWASRRISRLVDPEERLEALARTWVAALARPRYATVLRELWSIRERESWLADAFDALYDELLEKMTEAMAACRPDLPSSQVELLAAFAIALVDGGLLSARATGRSDVARGDLSAEIPQRIVALVRDELPEKLTGADGALVESAVRANRLQRLS